MTVNIAPQAPEPHEADVVMFEGATWDDYKRLLRLRGEGSSPRISFLDGRMELMTPSRSHEALAERIGCLVEVWCAHHGVEFSPYGSWTLKKRRRKAGAEADQCYIFGVDQEKDVPDLAIEVEWSRHRLNKLTIYKRLQVPEVWIWRDGAIFVCVLGTRKYTLAPTSQLLPAIDLAQLVTFLDKYPVSAAMREYREALAQNG